MSSDERVKSEREAALSLAAMMTQTSSPEPVTANDFENTLSEIRKVMFDSVANYKLVMTMDSNVIELYNTFKVYWKVKTDTGRPATSSSSPSAMDSIVNKIKSNLAITKKIEADLGSIAISPLLNQAMWLPLAKQRDDCRKVTVLALKEFQDLLKNLSSPQIEALEKRLLDLCKLIKSQKVEVSTQSSSSSSLATSKNTISDFPFINIYAKQNSSEKLAGELFPSSSDGWSEELQQDLSSIDSSRSKELSEKMRKMKDAVKDFVDSAEQYTKQLHQIHQTKCEPHANLLIERIELAINERRKAEKLSHWFSDIEYQTLEREQEIFTRRLQIDKQLELITGNSERLKSIINKALKLKAESEIIKANDQDMSALDEKRKEVFRELATCKEEEDKILSGIIGLSRKRIPVRQFGLVNDPLMPKRSQSAGLPLPHSIPLLPGSSASASSMSSSMSSTSSSSLTGSNPAFLNTAPGLHPFDFDFPELPLYALILCQCNKNINVDINYVTKRLSDLGILRYSVGMPPPIHQAQLLQQHHQQQQHQKQQSLNS